MKRMSPAALERARQFLKTEARPLEKALFEAEFEGAPLQPVWDSLKAFQNEDGGFGRGLEPDVRCKASSALATSLALQTLSGCPAGDAEAEAMIQGAVRYVIRTFRPDKPGWDIVPVEAGLEPRAVWWNKPERFPWGNPNAELLGYLTAYQDRIEISPALMERLTGFLEDYLERQCDYRDMHEMFCFARLKKWLALPRLDEALSRFVEHCIVADPSQRSGYCAVPLQMADSPESEYYARYAEVIPRDLDEWIDSQAPDGSWLPNWHWGQYEKEWQMAKREWQGILTLERLRVLRRYGRL